MVASLDALDALYACGGAGSSGGAHGLRWILLVGEEAWLEC